MDPKAAAEWMLKELNRVEYLYQEVVVCHLIEVFGPDSSYINNKGNQAIERRILIEFKKLSGDGIIWERSQRLWRKRMPYDKVSRQQD